MPNFEFTDDFEDHEYPEEDQYDEDSTVECSSCGAEVYDDSIRCPVCGEYITTGSTSLPPIWKFTAIFILVLGAIMAGQFVLGLLTR